MQVHQLHADNSAALLSRRLSQIRRDSSCMCIALVYSRRALQRWRGEALHAESAQMARQSCMSVMRCKKQALRCKANVGRQREYVMTSPITQMAL